MLWWPVVEVEGIEIAGVSHRYGRRQSLVGVNLDLPVGVTGLLGPNGAGKSTLMKLLATAMPLQEGSIRFGETSVVRATLNDVRRLVGYLPQRFEVMGWSTVRGNVEYAAWAQGVAADQIAEAVDASLTAVDLQDRAGSRARSLSGGMRQRLGLACALVHRPPVVILDEPTVGLDPVQRRDLRGLINGVAKTSVVLMSTHLVEDLATVAEKVVVLHDGLVRFDGSLTELRVLGDATAGEHASALEAGYHAALESVREEGQA